MALSFEILRDATPADGERILAASAILEARGAERLAFRLGLSLLFIGALIAFFDPLPLIVLAYVGLFVFLTLLAAAHIHWMAASVHMDRAELLRRQETGAPPCDA